MPETNNLDWKKYEAITKYIYETLGKKSGVTVKGYGSSCKVVGKSGVSHQIDVLTAHSDGIHNYQTAIECKYWNKKINKDIVMKVSELIEDTRINKGVIVSKNGFTPDGIDFARYKNIGLVELREANEKDLEGKPRTIDLGILELRPQISRTRSEILSIQIETDEGTLLEKEFDDVRTFIRLSNGTQTPLIRYKDKFRIELADIGKELQTVTKCYDLSGATLTDPKDNSSVKIKGIVFTGMRKKTDHSFTRQFTLVDQVWLIMTSMFDGVTFTITENGIIIKK